MCSDLCGVGLFNDNGCRFGTQRQRWKTSKVQQRKATVTIVMAEAMLKIKRVTLIKTRLLRKGQSSGFDTMLEILENLYCIFLMRKYTSVPYIGGISVRYK